MCGLWGYAGEACAANADTLTEILTLASRRGPDGFGLWCDGVITHGAGTASLDSVDCSAAVIVGHARLATVLDTKQPEHNQPIQRGNI
uniref:hypothetical protein n=1 Tax=Burkholderia diffusa TaxID=488732 RepID=UPI001CC3936C